MKRQQISKQWCRQGYWTVYECELFPLLVTVISSLLLSSRLFLPSRFSISFSLYLFYLSVSALSLAEKGCHGDSSRFEAEMRNELYSHVSFLCTCVWQRERDLYRFWILCDFPRYPNWESNLDQNIYALLHLLFLFFLPTCVCLWVLILFLALGQQHVDFFQLFSSVFLLDCKR